MLDTGENCNTISRTLFEELIGRGLVSEFIKRPEAGVRIDLVGSQNLMISGDKAKMEVDVGIKTSIQEFLILEHDTEPLVMGVQWHSSLVGENCGDSTILVNMDTFGNPTSNLTLWTRSKMKLKKTKS